MEIIRGKQVSLEGASALAEKLAEYDKIHLDIGTGDGCFVQHMAQTNPNCLVIGIDACRENLQQVSRRAPANAMFVIANALALPCELQGLAAHLSLNFPWGSLLEGLLTDDSGLAAGLVKLMQARAALTIRLNGGALSEAGWSLEAGADRVRQVLAWNGFDMGTSKFMTSRELRSFPTTWAKRLAYGRDPRAICLAGISQS